MPVASRSKASVYGRSLAGIAGSNPAGGGRMFGSYECCVLASRGFCDGPNTRPEESYQMWGVLSVIEERHSVGPGPLGLSNHEKNIILKGAYGTSDEIINTLLITVRKVTSVCTINI